MSRNKPFARAARPRSPGAPAHTAPAASPPVPPRRVPSSEELFGREPFTVGPMPRYYGTGVAGYRSGPGFTGGYYGFGGEPPLMPTELEREFREDVSGPDWRIAGQSAARPSLAPAQRTAPARPYRRGPKGYRRSDERIREDLCDRLMRARHIDSSEVSVEVENGTVVLEGTVPQRRMKHALEDLADACLGVEDIDNRVRVAVNPAA
jgi:hypothetical protein